ncbi:hypothetical protein BDZ89DRAFT_1068557 [Hymenopellis radicata]|nr:hypothetical protein BDZ89DRAFT_1068557 [Hymenopellis radicata]
MALRLGGVVDASSLKRHPPCRHARSDTIQSRKTVMQREGSDQEKWNAVEKSGANVLHCWMFSSCLLSDFAFLLSITFAPFIYHHC